MPLRSGASFLILHISPTALKPIDWPRIMPFKLPQGNLAVNAHAVCLRSADDVFWFLRHNRAEVGEVDRQRRKELLASYKFRRPEMGVISYHCKASGDVFLATFKDTRASFNSTNM